MPANRINQGDKVRINHDHGPVGTIQGTSSWVSDIRRCIVFGYVVELDEGHFWGDDLYVRMLTVHHDNVFLASSTFPYEVVATDG